jgi:uncharacterized protein with HEPN domain
MYDTELVKEILRQILWSAQTIAKRFAPITSPEDFVASESGLEKLDAICMQLIAIGESVKHLDKVTAGGLLFRYPQIEWKRVMGMRDGHGSVQCGRFALSPPKGRSLVRRPLLGMMGMGRRFRRSK